MDVQNVSHTNPAELTARASNSEMGKEEFLRLLVTQLSNQDPLNPMDGQEFAAQLAQFTSVEQLLNIQQTLVENGQLNSMLAEGINSGVASGLIGRTVEAQSTSIHWDGSGSTKLQLEIPSAASSVKAIIRDGNGDIVSTLDLGARESGRHDIEWNGRDSRGAAVATGSYHIEIEATDADGGGVNWRTFVAGRVDRVTFGQDGIKLWMGELPLAMGHVTAVSD